MQLTMGGPTPMWMSYLSSTDRGMRECLSPRHDMVRADHQRQLPLSVALGRCKRRHDAASRLDCRARLVMARSLRRNVSVDIPQPGQCSRQRDRQPHHRRGGCLQRYDRLSTSHPLLDRVTRISWVLLFLLCRCVPHGPRTDLLWVSSLHRERVVGGPSA